MRYALDRYAEAVTRDIVLSEQKRKLDLFLQLFQNGSLLTLL